MSRRRWALAALMPLLVSVGVSLGAVAQDAGLAGRWTASFTVDDGAGGTKTVTGTIVAVAGRPGQPVRGSYRIPFSTVGLGPDAAPATLQATRGDAVRIVLNPNGESGQAELTGTWKVGAIEGEWRWVGGPKAASGRFTLRR